MYETMLALAALLAVIGVAALIALVVAAFRDSTKQGLLSLFVPGYALYYGWRRMHRPLLPVGAVAALLGAGLLATFSSALGPQLTLEEEDPFFEEGFEDLEPP